ncbi:putative multicopper oxidase, type 1 [Aureobasidium sp. EXF-12298]|nr:putative multicopper oxidase, type 1 [Aureobasidium sp. EXF-12298]KAI4757619.1 putative multicopper oxidase, type 1 [Aureobasidium sp. EXF-12344]KAI4774677.1 putative multicopper oxidase, type 1 [Aureobasidium sp. EXF-3400]
MTLADEEVALSETSEQWSDGLDQRRALLDDEKVRTHVEAWSFRWWQYALLFLISVILLVPFAVNLAPKGSSWKEVASIDTSESDPGTEGQQLGQVESPSQPQSTGGVAPPKDEYLLDPAWDYGAAPTTRQYHWTLTETELNPDGVWRPMLLINDQFPGPLIEVNEHDTIRVTVDNRMTNASAVHWHGIYQNGTNSMDGTVGITGCPIAPNHTFTYEFKVQGQSGSYWYHAHQGIQASDGLMGPLIIHSKDEKQLQQIQYASDRIIMLSDHYHDLSGALARKYLSPDMENAEPVPDGALINGRAIRNCDDLPHRRCDNTTSNVGIPAFDLEPNRHHRLRIINVGAFAEFQFQIDEHELAVTEVDGTDVHPINYHRLNINPAQRYSVVVHTDKREKTSFRMRARMITHCFAEPNPYMADSVHGIVQYSGISEPMVAHELPNTIDWDEAIGLECKDLNTTELVPVQVVAAPTKPDAFFYLRSNFEIGAYRLSRGKFNTSTWHSDVKNPTLFRSIDGLQAKNASFDAKQDDGTVFVNDRAFNQPTELTIQSSGVQTIDLLISNFDDGNHPYHLHGYKFWVLAQGHGYPPRKSLDRPMDLDNLSPLYESLDLANPMRRDTTSVEAFGWALIRFVADNPGAWAFHCHVSWHAEAGLLMQFITRTDLLIDSEISEAHRELCRADGLEKGMGPKDEIYYDEA